MPRTYTIPQKLGDEEFNDINDGRFSLTRFSMILASAGLNKRRSETLDHTLFKERVFVN